MKRTFKHDRLISWDDHLEKQKRLCEKIDADWQPINPELKIGISTSLSTEPIHGLRHNPEEGTSGWFIWSGEYSDDKDFFQPIHASHLLELRPEIIKYLGLPPGYRFLVDNKGYEDIWIDLNLINK
jgi:hypothetical protein